MKILLVDDDHEIIKFLSHALSNQCFEVDTATDGEKASFLAKTNNYDLIILDYALPKKDGRIVCKELREEGLNTPILMLSVQTETEKKTDLLNSGADDYVDKPFSFDELLARIKALMRRPQELKQELLQIDDLVLDVNRHLVKRGNKAIYLTLKEFMLLEYLMKNKGMVLSRAMILEHVWDMNADLFSNTIEAHISNLRRKVDSNGKRKLISTIPGRGYKIEAE